MAEAGQRGFLVRGGPRFYLVARLAFMLAAPAPLIFGFAPGTTAFQRTTYTAGLLLIEAGGLVLLARWNHGAGLPALLRVVLPAVDIAGMTIMGFVASPAVPDPLYPAFVGLPVLYALLVPRHRASWIGLLAAVGYLASSSGQVTWEYFTVLVHVEKVLCIPAVTWVVSAAVDVQLQRLQHLQVVTDVAEALHTSLDAEFLPPRTLEQLAGLLTVERWCLCIVDGPTRDILFEVRAGGEGEPAEMYSTMSSAPDQQDPPEPDETLEEHRLLVHDEAAAVFYLPPGRFTRLSGDEHIVLDAVSRELLVAVENRRLFGVTKHLSVTDALTGLYNRRHLSCRIVEEIARCRRFGTCVSLLMVDGDDFKQVNDVHGHDVGDGVLAELADLMVASVRGIDVVARFGGEEFCLLLPETGADGAQHAAEKLCDMVACHRFVNGVQLTVSVGVATFPDSADSAEHLLRAADNAMYAAKTSGKSRVCVHEQRAEFAS